MSIDEEYVSNKVLLLFLIVCLSDLSPFPSPYLSFFSFSPYLYPFASSLSLSLSLLFLHPPIPLIPYLSLHQSLTFIFSLIPLIYRFLSLSNIFSPSINFPPSFSSLSYSLFFIPFSLNHPSPSCSSSHNPSPSFYLSLLPLSLFHSLLPLSLSFSFLPLSLPLSLLPLSLSLSV